MSSIDLVDRIKAKQKEVKEQKDEIWDTLIKLPNGHYRVSFSLGLEVDFVVDKDWFFKNIYLDYIHEGQRVKSQELTPYQVTRIHKNLDIILKRIEEQYAE